MAWRDDLHLDGKGSFKGIEFFVDSVESGVGRRTVVHQFPGRDKPYVEDLGQDTTEFSFNAYLLGDDYITERDELRDALTAGGPGILVHPYWGTFTAQVIGKVRVRETPSQGGIARMTIAMVEVEPISEAPIIEPDTEADITAAADAAANGSVEQFIGVDVDEASRAAQFARGEIPDADAWTITNVIEDVRDKALEGGNILTGLMSEANGYVDSVMNTTDDVGGLITDFGNELNTLILTPETFANNIQSLVGKVVGKFGEFEGIWNDYVEAAESLVAPGATPGAIPSGGTMDTGSTMTIAIIKTLEQFNTFGDDIEIPTGTTPMELIVKGNRAALITLVKTSALLEICKAITEVSFASYDDATDVRDVLSSDIDAVADEAGDITYAVMQDLRTAVVRHLTESAAELPRVVPYVPTTELPALVIAQHLYGDARYDADIVARNNVRNPCRVPGGVELEVLSSE